MAENKKSFVLYVDLIHTVEELTDTQAGRLLKHILRYVNDKNPQPPDKLTKVAFEPIKQQLKRDLVKWESERGNRSEAGKKGMRNRWGKNNKPYQGITDDNSVITGITNITDSVSVDVNVSVDEREGSPSPKNLDESIRGEIFYNVEELLLNNQIQLEKICMATGRKKPEALRALRKYHLFMEEKENYPKPKKALFSGFEKWLMNEKKETVHQQEQELTSPKLTYK